MGRLKKKFHAQWIITIDTNHHHNAIILIIVDVIILIIMVFTIIIKIFSQVEWNPLSMPSGSPPLTLSSSHHNINIKIVI